MTSFRKCSALSIVTAFLCAVGQAEAKGPYVSAFGGGVWTKDQSLIIGGVPSQFVFPGFVPVVATMNIPPVDRLAIKGGVIYGGALGYEFGGKQTGGLRLELEGSRRSNDLGSSSANGPLHDFTGSVDSTAFMGNILLVAPSLGGVRPYVGGGVGAARVKTDVRNAIVIPDDDSIGPFCIAPPSTVDLNVRGFAGKKSKIAYQGIAGASIDVAPKFSLFAEGRYLRSKGHAYDADFSVIIACGMPDQAATGFVGTGRYSNLSAVAGLRFSF